MGSWIHSASAYQLRAHAYTAPKHQQRVKMAFNAASLDKTTTMRFVQHLNQLMFYLRMLRREALFAQPEASRATLWNIRSAAAQLHTITRLDGGMLAHYESVLATICTRLATLHETEETMNNPIAILCAIDSIATGTATFAARLDSVVGDTWGARIDTRAM
jgi:nicotinate-nucleotide pyrophosphorylase